MAEGDGGDELVALAARIEGLVQQLSAGHRVAGAGQKMPGGPWCDPITTGNVYAPSPASGAAGAAVLETDPLSPACLRFGACDSACQ